MADYTPTDDEVRSMFCIGISDPTNPKPVPARSAYDGYDRWLAKVKADAWDEGFITGDSRAMYVRNPHRDAS